MSLFYVGYSKAACTGTRDIEANADGDICINEATIAPVNRGIFSTTFDNATLDNRGTISLSDANGIVLNFSNNSTLVNSGNINGDGYAGMYVFSGSGNTIFNSGNINLTSGFGIYNYASSSIDSITNTLTGIIHADQAAIYNEDEGSIGTITNAGNIISSSHSAIENYGSIGTIDNTGQLLGVDGADGCKFNYQCGIYNYSGTIGTLNNAQFGLTYQGKLPENYNIILGANAANYGTVHFTEANNFDGNAGKTIFGIIGSVKSTQYLGVFSNLPWPKLSLDSGSSTTKTGIYNQNNYELVLRNGTGLDGNGSYIWDLFFPDWVYIPSGPTAADTQASLHSLAPKLRGAFSSQTVATNFANMNTYDCNLFDAKGLCISVGGQKSYVDSPSSNMTSTIVVAGYKVSTTLRIGGFLNQNMSSNSGSNVDISNKSPLMGLFAVWNQNDNKLGFQLKIANAYQDKDVRITRDAYGDTGEAGKGKTKLNTQSYVSELSYAFLANEDKTLIRPYAAVRYTRIKQNGYTEETSAGVTTPLTYTALSDRSTAALVGVKLNHKLADKVNFTGSLGVEQDIHHYVDDLTATGVADLTSENFNDNIKRTRPVASIGAYYMPVKNQRIAADIYYQQLPFQSTASTTAYVNYTIGF